LNTKLILDAKKLGLKTMSGLLMLVAQAFYAAEIFLNEKLDENLIEEMYSKIKRNMENIILIGMPSSGKTTMGRLLSKKLNREFFDTDNLIEEEENLSVSEIFENKGEKYFRDLETKILEEVSKKNGIVIATGGGTPIKEVNRDMILQNSIVIYLNRNIEKLETFGRPLSKNLKTLEKMYDKRNPIYSDLSDIKINVIEDKEKTLELILEEFEKYENFSN
ncbi:MAG: shikimate kinase, partial [Peptoniphilus lacydonensis]|nr:shikimate kinase [Peptoniphilus lacydonensis]